MNINILARKGTWLIAAATTLPAYAAPPGVNVDKLDPESILPTVPLGVTHGDGELIRTKDLFHGKQIVIQLESTQGRLTRDYQAQRDVVLRSRPIREQDNFLVFDSVGEAYKRPDGFVYVKTTSIKSGQVDWFVSCVRWKPKWESGHGCVLRGHNGGKHYEVIFKEADLSFAEDVNAFVLGHL